MVVPDLWAPTIKNGVIGYCDGSLIATPTLSSAALTDRRAPSRSLRHFASSHDALESRKKRLSLPGPVETAVVIDRLRTNAGAKLLEAPHNDAGDRLYVVG